MESMRGGNFQEAIIARGSQGGQVQQIKGLKNRGFENLEPAKDVQKILRIRS